MADSPHPLRVVKIGGSLLALGDLNQRIADWIVQQAPATTIWMVGGGEPVEKIRQQHPRPDADAQEVHWSCVQKMDDNNRHLTSWFPGWRRFDSVADIDDAGPVANLILSTWSWTRRHASHLPMTWDVTSDSIAATLALGCAASELVLLKSVDPPIGSDIEEAIAAGFVDRYFLRALQSRHSEMLPGNINSVRVVNLRSPSFSETVWDAKAWNH